jgi:bacterial leucyl aminopeptidase
MKSALALLSLVTLALAGPVLQFEGDADQQFLGLPTTYPGYDLDLNEQRLVELEGQPPKWVSELEKVCCSYGWSGAQ